MQRKGVNKVPKQMIYDEVNKLAPLCQEICRKLWANPETGGNEKKSADYIRGILEKEGFAIVNESHLPHAFYAEYGSGAPVIAVLGEYDALPALSQKCSPEKEPVIPGGPGHGCGHNLLGSASVTASIAIKRILEEEGISGTVRFYGCPEEELLCGKVKMAYYHMFDGCNIALSWHPMYYNMIIDEGYLANASVKFHFTGQASHASAAPEKGRSALDAVELMNVGCNYLREHVIDSARIHYTTDSGGFAPNIVPAKASAWYFVRAPYMADVKEILGRIEKIAQGAALMTETEVTVELEYGCCEMAKNRRFADLTYENLLMAEQPVYTEDEKSFARALQAQLDPANLKKEEKLFGVEGEPLFTGVAPRGLWEKAPLTGSSDSGDVSQLMPMNMFTTTCWPVGCAPHTWQSAAASGSSIGEKGALYAARVIAGTAYDLLTQPTVLEKIQREFAEQDTGTYTPMFEE